MRREQANQSGCGTVGVGSSKMRMSGVNSGKGEGWGLLRRKGTGETCRANAWMTPDGLLHPGGNSYKGQVWDC